MNYNRYGYCYNNPLVYTDPSGEFIGIAIGIGALLGAYIGGSAAEGWEYNPGKWDWDRNTWTGIGAGAVIGAAGGYGFFNAAPALANTGFFAHFGASGTVAAYTLTGGAAGGAIGYGSGFTGGMLYSNGDWGYSHQSGIHGAKVGATVGSVIGAIGGTIQGYNPPPNYDFEVSKSIDQARNRDIESDLLMGELDPLSTSVSMSSLQMNRSSHDNRLHDYTLERIAFPLKQTHYQSGGSSYGYHSYSSHGIRKSYIPHNQHSFKWKNFLLPIQTAIELYWWKNPYGSFPYMPLFPPMIEPDWWAPRFNQQEFELPII